MAIFPYNIYTFTYSKYVNADTSATMLMSRGGAHNEENGGGENGSAPHLAVPQAAVGKEYSIWTRRSTYAAA